MNRNSSFSTLSELSSFTRNENKTEIEPLDNGYEKDDDSEENKEDEEDNYTFTTAVNKSLSEVLGITIESIIDQNNKNEHKIVWDIPKEYGLQNSNYIIPSYYQFRRNQNNLLEIEYYDMIKDDITNYRKLNEYQLRYIKEMNDEQKNEIIALFNECIGAVSDLI
jgi:hypothetical protein